MYVRGGYHILRIDKCNRFILSTKKNDLLNDCVEFFPVIQDEF